MDTIEPSYLAGVFSLPPAKMKFCELVKQTLEMLQLLTVACNLKGATSLISCVGLLVSSAE